MNVASSNSLLRQGGIAAAGLDPSTIARDPFLSPSEKLRRLRNMMETLTSGTGAKPAPHDSIAVYRAIFELYDRHRADLKPFIYE